MSLGANLDQETREIGVLDIGGTNYRQAIAIAKWDIKEARWKIEIQEVEISDTDGDNFAQQIENGIRSLKVQEVAALIPGVVKDGVIISAPNIPTDLIQNGKNQGKEGFDLGSLIKNLKGIQNVDVINDALGKAARAIFANALDTRCAVAATISTGVGASVATRYGEYVAFSPSEIGHAKSYVPEKSWEQLLSGKGVASLYNEQGLEGNDPRQMNKLYKGDERINIGDNRWNKAVGQFLADLGLIFPDQQVIELTGGVVDAMVQKYGEGIVFEALLTTARAAISNTPQAALAENFLLSYVSEKDNNPGLEGAGYYAVNRASILK